MPANPFPVNKLFYSCVFFREETPIRANLENYKQTVFKAESKYRYVFIIFCCTVFFVGGRGGFVFFGESEIFFYKITCRIEVFVV
jgi:hypothetical protein